MPDFQKIGEFAVEKANEYKRAIEVHSQLVKEQNALDKEIHEAEFNHSENLPELYKKFRVLKAEQEANQCFRQKFCDDFLFEIEEMAKYE